jgi:hypothetical protein
LCTAWSDREEPDAARRGLARVGNIGGRAGSAAIGVSAVRTPSVGRELDVFVELVEGNGKVERFDVHAAVSSIFDEFPVALNISPPELDGALSTIRCQAIGKAFNALVSAELVAEVVAGGRLREHLDEQASMPFGIAVGSVARIAGHDAVGVGAAAGRNDLHCIRNDLHCIGEGSAIGSS